VGLRAVFERWSARRGTSIESYGVQESSTPIDPADTSGGSSQLTFVIRGGNETKALRDRLVDFEDGSNGTTQGIVRAVSVSNDFLATITADSRVALLNEKRITKPYRGSLAGAFRYYFGLVGIVDGIFIERTLEQIPVKLGGFEGNLYERVRELCVARQVELSLVSDKVVVRPLRQREATNYRDSDVTSEVSTVQSALSIRVNYYEPRDVSDHLIYPAGGWNDDVSIISVDAGETTEVEVELPGSFESIKQPRAVEFVGPNEGSDSVYTVSGNDGLPIPVRQWTEFGGQIKVAISDDTRNATITVIGANLPTLGPFTIAMSSDTSDGYSSLRVVGTGLLLEPQTIEIQTGADENKVSSEVGVEIANEYIGSKSEAYDVAVWSLMKFTGPIHGISVSTRGINRRGVSGSLRFPTIAEFNALYEGMTIYDFDQVWSSSRTIGDFNDTMIDIAREDFANQAFGNVAGARVRNADSYFRIRDASIGMDGISYTAEADTTLADFDRAWEGFIIADFDKQWAGKTIQEFNVSPLTRDPQMRSSVLTGYGSGRYGRRPYGK
jgi:hypothetical protein